MLKNILIFIIIIVSAAFQVSFLPHIFSSEHIPDFLLILVIFWATRMDFYKVLVWIILSGIVLDGAYFAPPGLNVFSFIFTAYGLNYLSRRILLFRETWKFFIISGFVVIGTLVNDWILLAFGRINMGSGLPFNWGLFLNQDIFLKILYNIVIFAIIYWPLVRLEKFFIFYGARLNMNK